MTLGDPTAFIGEHEQVLTSDYFSFVGADARGRVAFAIDNNRYRKGDSYQAEHTYVVLHDEHQGWQPVAGRGYYRNQNRGGQDQGDPDRDLIAIPDSEFFRFSGAPATGMTVTSPVNGLSLEINPIPQQVPYGDDDSLFHMGAAAAVLTWQGRTVHGRVIYEYLVKLDFNLMRSLGEFQGLYLLADSSSDLYVHQSSMEIAGPMPAALGFAVAGGEYDQFKDIRFSAKKRGFNAGLYRWPRSWDVRWEGRKGSAVLKMELATQTVIGNWIVAGFAMGIVRGELSYDGRRTPVYGLSEIIMITKLGQMLARFRSK